MIACYGFLALHGLATAFTKYYGVARSFSICWWVLTAVTSVALVVEIAVYGGLTVRRCKSYDWVELCGRPRTVLTEVFMLLVQVGYMLYFGVAIHRYAQELNPANAGDPEEPTTIRMIVAANERAHRLGQ